MKYKLLILIVFLIPIVKVEANETEDLLNSISNKIQSMKTEVNKLDLLKKYPVGSIYISTSSTNPSSLFGGTWQSFGQGRTLIGAGSNGTTNYTNGSQSGSSTKSITISNIPSHSHTITPSGTVTSSFTGKSVNTNSTGSHNHTLQAKKASTEVSGYGLLTISGGANSYYDRVMVTTTNSNKKSVNSAGAHTHTMTSSGTVTSTFTGKSVTTSSTGSTTAFSIQNPYIVVYMWKRTA